LFAKIWSSNFAESLDIVLQDQAIMINTKKTQKENSSMTTNKVDPTTAKLPTLENSAPNQPSKLDGASKTIAQNILLPTFLGTGGLFVTKAVASYFGHTITVPTAAALSSAPTFLGAIVTTGAIFVVAYGVHELASLALNKLADSFGLEQGSSARFLVVLSGRAVVVTGLAVGLVYAAPYLGIALSVTQVVAFVGVGVTAAVICRNFPTMKSSREKFEDTIAIATNRFIAAHEVHQKAEKRKEKAQREYTKAKKPHSEALDKSRLEKLEKKVKQAETAITKATAGKDEKEIKKAEETLKTAQEAHLKAVKARAEAKLAIKDKKDALKKAERDFIESGAFAAAYSIPQKELNRLSFAIARSEAASGVVRKPAIKLTQSEPTKVQMDVAAPTVPPAPPAPNATAV